MFTSAASITSTINLITSLFCLRCRYIDDNKQFFCGENITYFVFNLSNADTELYENSAFGQLWLVKVCKKFLLFENVSVESTFSGSVYILLPLLDIKLWIDTSCWMGRNQTQQKQETLPPIPGRQGNRSSNKPQSMIYIIITLITKMCDDVTSDGTCVLTPYSSSDCQKVWPPNLPLKWRPMARKGRFRFCFWGHLHRFVAKGLGKWSQFCVAWD